MRFLSKKKRNKKENRNENEEKFFATLFICLVVVLCLGLVFTLTACGEEKYGSDSELTYALKEDDDGNVEGYVVTGYIGDAVEIVISDTYNEIPVTEIGEKAFYKCETLKSVEISDSVTAIGRAAFDGCTALTSIVIPNSVVDMSDYTFFRCSSLVSVELGSSVSSIGYDSFGYCYSLEKVNIPDSVTKIDMWAFTYCESLTSMVIPDSVSEIRSYAVSYCTGLETVTIGKSVALIDSYAFHGCTGLTEIYYNAENATGQKTLNSGNLGPFSNTGSDGLKLIIGEGVETIPSGMFYAYDATDASTLTTIEWEGNSSLISVGDMAFYNCTSLTAVYYPGSSSDWLGIEIGSDNTTLTSATMYYA